MSNFSVKATFDGQELIQGFKDVKTEINGLKTAGQSAGQSLDKMLQQRNSTTNYTRQLSQIKQQLTDLSVNYSRLSEAERKSEFGVAMAAKIDELKIKAQELKGVFDEVNESLKGESVADFGEQWSNLQRQTEQTRAKFESVQKMASGVASGFAAVQGAAALLGGENENLQKTLVKVQSAMAIAQGIGGIKDLMEGFQQAKLAFSNAASGLKIFRAEAVLTTTTMEAAGTATAVATKGVNTFKMALVKTGIGAIIVGIGYALAKVIEHWDTICEKLGFAKKKTDELSEADKKLKERTDKINSSVADQISKFNLLQSSWNNLSTDQEKNQWITDNADAFSDLGLAIMDVASAQDVLVNKAAAVVKALTLQAEAAALQEIYQESYKEAYLRAKELDSQMANILANPVQAGYDTDDEFREKYNLGSNAFNKKTGYFQYTTRQEWSRLLGDYQTIYTYTDKLNQKGAEFVQQQKIAAVQAQKDVVYAESNSILKDLEAKQEEANAAAAEVAQYYTPKRGSGGGSSGGTTKPRTLQEEQAEFELYLGKLDKLYEEGRISQEEYYRERSSLANSYKSKLEELPSGIVGDVATQYDRATEIITKADEEISKLGSVQAKVKAYGEYTAELARIAELEEDGILSITEARHNELNAARKYYNFLTSNYATLSDTEKQLTQELQDKIELFERADAIELQVQSGIITEGEAQRAIAEINADLQRLGLDPITIDVIPSFDRVARGRTIEYRESRADKANVIMQQFDAGIITQDVAQRAIDEINADLASLQLNPIEVNLDTTEAISNLEAFNSTANGVFSSIQAVGSVVSSIDSVVKSYDQLDEAMAEAKTGWDRFMVGFNFGMQILNAVTSVLATINTLVETFNTLQAISTALKLKDATASGVKASADTAAATAAGTEAAANTAAAVSGAAKSVSWIPIVGAVLAVAAIAAVVGGIIAATNKAKFATGGIVPGNRIGDMNMVRVNGGEMILNGRQQKNLFTMLDQNRLPQFGGGSADVNFRIQGDALVGVIENYNKKRSRR